MSRPLDDVLKVYEGVVGPKSHMLLTARANLAALRADSELLKQVRNEVKLLRRIINRYAAGEKDSPCDEVRGQLAIFEDFLYRVDTRMPGEPTDLEVISEVALATCAELILQSDGLGDPQVLKSLVEGAMAAIDDAADLNRALAEAIPEQPAASQPGLIDDRIKGGP